MELLRSDQLVAETREQHALEVADLAPEIPSLAIVRAVGDLAADQVTGSYVRIKQRYGESIGAIVSLYDMNQSHISGLLNELNADESVHGIIVQLPLTDPRQTDELCNAVDPHKDVDGLHDDSDFDPATPSAIINMLDYYQVDMGGNLVIVGRGKLVGAPLINMLYHRDLEPVIIDESNSELLPAAAKQADVLITATGVPGLIKSEMLRDGAVVIDAGVASEGGVLRGDVSQSVYDSNLDIRITPTKGGVGPATVSALFDNVIRAAHKKVR